MDRLDQAQIANARLNTVREFAEHPQLQARNRWSQVDSPSGPIKVLIPPVTLEGVDTVMNPIPSVGEHSELVLKELGFEASTIQQWREQGVI